MKNRRTRKITDAALFLVLTWLTPAASAQELPPPAREIPLYPGVAPGSEKWDWNERFFKSPTGIPMVQNVVRPVMQYYPPDKSKAIGTAMIVVPGGAFMTLMMSYEGVDIAKHLNEVGLHAFILKHRLVHLDPTQPRGPTALDRIGIGSDGAQAGQNLRVMAAADGRQAVRVLRERASEFGVRQDRIGMIGFSAGGYVTVAAVTGPPETRPNFAAPIYAAVGLPWLPPEELSLTPPAGAPPLFIALAADDQMAGYQGSLDLFLAWRKAGIPAELHVFQTGGHGFMKKGGGADHFMDRLVEWLRLNGWLSKAND
jgi:dienelactone hydrolase